MHTRIFFLAVFAWIWTSIWIWFWFWFWFWFLFGFAFVVRDIRRAVLCAVLSAWRRFGALTFDTSVRMHIQSYALRPKRNVMRHGGMNVWWWWLRLWLWYNCDMVVVMTMIMVGLWLWLCWLYYDYDRVWLCEYDWQYDSLSMADDYVTIKWVWVKSGYNGYDYDYMNMTVIITMTMIMNMTVIMNMTMIMIIWLYRLWVYYMTMRLCDYGWETSMGKIGLGITGSDYVYMTVKYAWLWVWLRE